MNEVLELVKKHDKYYAFSDDMRYYSKGQEEQKAIVKAIMAANCCDEKEADRIYHELTK